MAEKLDPKQTVDFKELLISEVIQTEALTNLLDRKGIISKTVNNELSIKLICLMEVKLIKSLHENGPS